jgi:hypothetical protein
MSLIARDDELDTALTLLFEAFDQSGLTDLRWFVPYMEAVRRAWERQPPRGAVEALERLADPDSWPAHVRPHRHTVRFAQQALDNLGEQP